MEYLIGGLIFWLWISLGFGVKAILMVLDASIAKFPLLPILWPIVLLIAAYSPDFIESISIKYRL